MRKKQGESEMMKKQWQRREREMIDERKNVGCSEWELGNEQEPWNGGRKRGVLPGIAQEAFINTGPYLRGVLCPCQCATADPLSATRCAMALEPIRGSHRPCSFPCSLQHLGMLTACWVSVIWMWKETLKGTTPPHERSLNTLSLSFSLDVNTHLFLPLFLFIALSLSLPPSHRDDRTCWLLQ